MSYLEAQYDHWMREEKPEIEDQSLEYFKKNNDEEIYIKGNEPAEYEVWQKGELWDDELTLAQALDTANDLYRLMQDDDDYFEPFQLT